MSDCAQRAPGSASDTVVTGLYNTLLSWWLSTQARIARTNQIAQLAESTNSDVATVERLLQLREALDWVSQSLYAM